MFKMNIFNCQAIYTDYESKMLNICVLFFICIAVCTPACQNNGHCSSRDGRPVCVCPENFAGDHCETREYITFIIHHLKVVRMLKLNFTDPFISNPR